MEINVNKVDDTFYRYKMPKLLAKVEGKGNGIKTVIVNMSEIAKSIYRKPSYPTKYFGFELGAQIKLDERHDRYIVNGCHEAARLQEILFGFIKKFVLCQSCENPETSLIVKKPLLYYKCRACGFSDQIDPTHRLTAFIVKNPPETELEGAFITQDSKLIEDTLPDSENVAWNKEPVSQIAAVNIESLSLIDDIKLESKKSLAVEFREYIENLFNTRQIILKRDEIPEKAESCRIGNEFILIVMEVVFCNRDTILQDVERYKGLFIYFTRRGFNDYDMQSLILKGMESLIHSFNIVSKSCHFLKTLYDNDIIEEEVILKWYKNGPSSANVPLKIAKEIMDHCLKMIEWLEAADEESDED